MRTVFRLAGFLLAAAGYSAGQTVLTPGTEPFIAFRDPIIALQHVRVIDGTGSPVRANQTVIIDHGLIASITDSASVRIRDGARIIEASGRTVYPGLVGMHEHLFYPSGFGVPSTTNKPYRRRVFIWRRASPPCAREVHLSPIWT